MTFNRGNWKEQWQPTLLPRQPGEDVRQRQGSRHPHVAHRSNGWRLSNQRVSPDHEYVGDSQQRNVSSHQGREILKHPPGIIRFKIPPVQFIMSLGLRDSFPLYVLLEGGENKTKQ